MNSVSDSFRLTVDPSKHPCKHLTSKWHDRMTFFAAGGQCIKPKAELCSFEAGFEAIGQRPTK